MEQVQFSGILSHNPAQNPGIILFQSFPFTSHVEFFESYNLLHMFSILLPYFPFLRYQTHSLLSQLSK